MNVTPTQVDFIEAQARLALAHHEKSVADARYRTAEQYLRAAWDRMTAGEQAAVNHACVLLGEPEMVA